MIFFPPKTPSTPPVGFFHALFKNQPYESPVFISLGIFILGQSVPKFDKTRPSFGRRENRAIVFRASQT